MVDVIVIKKYPVYFTEFIRDKNLKLPRSYQTCQILQEKIDTKTRTKIQTFIAENQKMEANELEEALDKIRRNPSSFFKAWFKIKVIDVMRQ